MASEEAVESKKPLFRDLGAQIDLDELEVSEIESMCMRCHKNVSFLVYSAVSCHCSEHITAVCTTD
jgi:hypothetical protein